MPYTYPKRIVVLAPIVEWLVHWASWLTWLRPASQPDAPVRRILIVEPFQMGDVVSLSVMLDPLREAYPDARIEVFTQSKASQVFTADPRVAVTHTCPVPWARYNGKLGSVSDWIPIWRSRRSLRKTGFDVGIDPRGDIRSQVLMLLAGCRRRIGFTTYLGSNLKARGFLLTDTVGGEIPRHRYEQNRAVLRPLLGDEIPPIHLPSLSADSIPGTAIAPDKAQILVHVGGGWIFKRWPNDRWIELINRVGKAPDRQVVSVGSDAERDSLDQITAELAVPFQIRFTEFNELIGLLKGSSLFVGLDSGPMNLAVALGVPVIALFGPGDSDAWFPLGKQDLVFHERDTYPCSPCFQRKCVFAERSCMTAIQVDEVAQAINQRLCEGR